MAGSLGSFLFYIFNRNKGITNNFCSELFEEIKNCKKRIKKQNKNENLINKLQSLEDLKQTISQSTNKHDITSKIIDSPLRYTITSKLLKEKLGMNPSFLDNVTQNKLQNLNNIDFTQDKFKEKIFEYSDLLYEYVNNHSKIKNAIPRGDKKDVIDLSLDVEQKDFENLLNQVFKKNSNTPQLKPIRDLVIKFAAIYNSETLIDNASLIEYELRSGDFDRHINILNEGKLKSEEERLQEFETYKNIEPENKCYFNDKDLLQKRCESLPQEQREEILKIIDSANDCERLEEQVDILQEAFLTYEVYNRENIVEKLYIPETKDAYSSGVLETDNSNQSEPQEKGIVYLSDYANFPTMMLHSFYRNPTKLADIALKNETKKMLEDGVLKHDGESSELTEHEKAKIEQRKEYVLDVLLNDAVVDKVADLSDAVYSDSSGFQTYMSNTQNQIATTIFSRDNIENLENSIGIGFNKNSITSENIALMSDTYQTTNKGIENIETEPNDSFKAYSATLEELQQNKNEVVLHRNGVEDSTKASFIYVALSGTERDVQLINKSKDMAEKNKLPLVVIDLKKIQEEKQITVEESLKPKIEPVSQDEINKYKEQDLKPQIVIEEKTISQKDNNLKNDKIDQHEL